MTSPLRLFADRAGSYLAGALPAPGNPGSTSLNLADGSVFPQIITNSNQFFAATLIDAATGLQCEIVHCTAISGNNLTVVRAQEGTTGQAWNVNDLFQKLLTSGDMESMVQQNQLLVPVYIYYQDYNIGNDSYSGTSATIVPNTSNPIVGPFKTIQGSINFIALYLSVSNVTLVCADYTTGPQSPFLIPPSFIGQWTLQGDDNTPANVTISNTGNTQVFGEAMQIQGGVSAFVSGFKFESVYASNISNFGAQLFLNNSWVTGSSSGPCISCVTGVANIIGALKVTGNGYTIFNANNTGGKLSLAYGGGSTVNQTTLAITITGTPTYYSFCDAQDCGLLYFSNTIGGTTTAITCTGSITGYQYVVQGNGTIDKSLNPYWHLPGSNNVTNNGGTFWGTP